MMSPAGSEHGWIVTNVTVPLAVFVKQRSLGRVFGAETGFRIGHDPDTVRADVAFVTAMRVGVELPPGFFPGPPDLAVEVLSPDDRAGEVLAKVQDWLDAGCRAVWVVDPRTRTVTVYRSRQRDCRPRHVGDSQRRRPAARIPPARERDLSRMTGKTDGRPGRRGSPMATKKCATARLHAGSTFSFSRSAPSRLGAFA